MRTSNAHQLNPLGYKKFRDSEMFSDVTIKFGDNGERPFCAHKVVLSSQSHWFQAAFTGNSQASTLKLKPTIRLTPTQENDLNDVVLKDDNPDAVDYMLRFAYEQPSVWAWKHLSGDPHFWLNIYEVADKSYFPELEEHAVDLLRWHWSAYLSKTVDATTIDYTGYRDVVNRIYDITNANRKHPLIGMLLGDLFKGEHLNLISSHGEILSVISKTADDNAEYGRDVPVHHMKSIGWGNNRGGTEIAITNKVKCPGCKKTWMRSYDTRDGECEYGCCWECGEDFSNWIDNEVDNKLGTWASREE